MAVVKVAKRDVTAVRSLPLYRYKDTDLASLTFPLGKHNMHIPVQPESHLRDFSALVLCTFGLCGMFLLTYE